MRHFHPGEQVPFTGVYEVMHHPPEPRENHLVIALFGEPFPACRECGAHVEFKLLRSAIHITADMTFDA